MRECIRTQSGDKGWEREMEGWLGVGQSAPCHCHSPRSDQPSLFCSAVSGKDPLFAACSIVRCPVCCCSLKINIQPGLWFFLSVIENTAYKTLPHWFCRTVKVWESFCRRGLFEYLSLICSSIRGCECHSTGHYAQAHAALGQKNL